MRDYLIMVKEELGPEWLDNHWFRFGASSLANDILIIAEGGRRALPERGLLQQRLRDVGLRLLSPTECLAK
ncbi:MAG: hypothetical protein IPL77_18165 [Flavobacteriales bacterium]|nr:hypothetical protein [Flavobacteriales bacterium]